MNANARSLLLTMLLTAGCATVDGTPKPREAPAPPAAQRAAQAAINQPEGLVYKRKVAIGRFSNETTYGRGLLVDADLDPLGKQAVDVLATELTRTERFIVIERADAARVLREQEIAGGGRLIGADALILGSVTEFGRKTEGKSGFLSSTKVQKAHARVNLRLVDVKSGRVFFAADGSGEALTESGEVAGFGSRAGYDSTLNEKAISAAIADVLDEVVRELEQRPWRSFILAREGDHVLVSGGARQGLRIGDRLALIQAGDRVVSQQSGFDVELPGTHIATLQVEAQFGDDEVSEGSVCSVVSGKAPEGDFNRFYVEAAEEPHP